MRKFGPILLLGIFALLSACSLPKAIPPTPTVTPGPSPTATLPPSPTSSPTPPSTPTPPPAARITSGDKAIFNGDYNLARQEYQAALAVNSADDIRAAALFGLGKADFMAENYPSALDSLRSLVQTYPKTEPGIRSWFLLGETYYALGRYQEAADAYQNYLTARPGLLDAYVQERRGNAFTALGDPLSAQKAYQAAAKADGQSNPTSINISIANTYLASGDAATALKMYDDTYDGTSNEYLKAQMDLLSGRALIALGRADEGYGRWRHAVDNYPLAYDSYSALLGLVDANQPVDEFNRGLVDYFSQHYDVALAAFQRFASQNPNHDGTVLHYKALTLREMGEYKAAIDTWDVLIDKYPGNRYWAAAWDEKAYTQWAYLNDYVGAAKGLEKFSSDANGSQFTSAYLLEAARIYERGGELDKAAQIWETLPDRFAGDPAMSNAWFQAGIVRYRQKNYSRANQDFQASLLLAKEHQDRARTLLWLGKTYTASGDTKNAQSAWLQASTVDSTNYYSIRARDLLDGREAFAAPPTMNLNYDLAKERAEAASWVRIKFNLPANTDLSNLGNLANDPRIQRGTEFWALGEYDLARVEFESLRESIKTPESTKTEIISFSVNENVTSEITKIERVLASTPAADSFRLGNYLLDLGAYRPAIFALREVLTLAGLDEHSDSLTAPAYFMHVRYGLYYSDIIWPASAENTFDPLFITSLVRQESFFEGFVRSGAGARGLMQIIPDTGASIATQMGWPAGYAADDLYSPYVSVRMGTYYLNANRRLLNNDLYAALAAYNGGPGNASIWQSLAQGDIDLELEIIRFSETRDYIRGIYETYDIYRSVYSPVQR